MTTTLLHLAADLVTMVVLAYGIYARRHHRRDLACAYLALSLGVCVAVSLLLSISSASALGLGLFGVLSIIRLRSDSITQQEVAYYFVALVVGLVNGVPSADWRLVAVFDVLLPAVLYLTDHPSATAATTRCTVVLEMAVTDDRALVAELQHRLGGTVVRHSVSEVDYVREVTVVDVRLRPHPAPDRRPIAGVR
ncbi:DUF4956 domain-containing protein [Amycolatopsis sp. CA-230715]|uniref:DUF4956 domain-containing protein n=1 Tax=Amycolatopsis sp. CA-230715 TaxID=2745196 RepID=UPI001C0325A4|nr:DUF4956 domain-containing protein [Amycolatopsis sp. CA-230715]QWF83138.1 hypothetical protein HUW46_06578 [Amycolatopsis sp. CA-230715]